MKKQNKLVYNLVINESKLFSFTRSYQQTFENSLTQFIEERRPYTPRISKIQKTSIQPKYVIKMGTVMAK